MEINTFSRNHFNEGFQKNISYDDLSPELQDCLSRIASTQLISDQPITTLRYTAVSEERKMNAHKRYVQ